MKVYNNIEQGSDEWHALKLGKITGTVAKSVMGTPVAYKTALYEIVGERLSTEIDDEDPMGRGVLLEPVARQAYEERTGVKVETVGFTERDDCKWIGSSPDGFVRVGDKYTIALEIKCLGAKNHIRAIEENAVPKEYYWQVIQYFVVNDDLQEVHFVLFNPNITKAKLHLIVVTRDSVKGDIEDALNKQKEFIQEANAIISKYIY
jgi:putative phage-type endonuclease